MIYYISALMVSVLWSFGWLFSFSPVIHWGALRYNVVKLTILMLVMPVIALMLGKAVWVIQLDISFLYILASGVIGIFVGDAFLFAALRRIGPRRMAILFALNGPMSLILGIIISGERYKILNIWGMMLVFLGIVIAVLFKEQQKVKLETVEGNYIVSILFGVLATFFHSLGLLLLKESNSSNIEPMIVSFWRIFAASFFYFIWLIISYFNDLSRKPKQAIFFPSFNKQNLKDYFYVIINSVLSVGLGTTLLVFALDGGKVGLVATLSSLTPIMILPLIWFVNKRFPNYKAWLGAIIATIGTFLIFYNIS